jgi:hypothetical protein
VIGADAVLRHDITEHLAGLVVRSAHRAAPFARSGSMVVREDHDVDPARVTFSAPC